MVVVSILGLASRSWTRSLDQVTVLESVSVNSVRMSGEGSANGGKVIVVVVVAI